MVQPHRDYTPDCPDHASGLYTQAHVESGHMYGSISDERMVADYKRDGYLAIHNVFSPVEIEAAIDGLEDLIRGKIELPQIIMIENKAPEQWDAIPEEERSDAVRKIGLGFTNYEPRLKAMRDNSRLLKIVSLLMNSQPPEMFQDMALIKPPKIGREKPWHQDQAYFDYAVQTPVVGCWIALDPATTDNGCMHVLAGQHLKPRWHFRIRDWQICDTEMLDQPATAVPLQPGGVLFFSGLLPHGTPTNNSSQKRRAVQFHYAPQGTQTLAHQSHIKFFGGRDNDVEC